MKRKIGRKVLVNLGVSLLSIGLLLAIVATPVIASVISGWVTSTDIKDGTIQTRDIRRDAITTSRIKDHSIRKEDLRSGSVNKYKLTSGAVNTYKILDGSVQNQDMADSAVDSAKIADGAVGSVDIADGSITDDDISGSAAISDSKISYDTTKTGYLTIPAAALQPIYQGYDFTNQGKYLQLNSGGPGYFTAPVNLPDGAIIQKITFWTYDDHDEDMLLVLYRVHDTGGMNTMAQASSYLHSTSWRSFSDESVLYSPVDNSAYSYIIQMALNGAGTDLKAGNTRITYEYLSPGS